VLAGACGERGEELLARHVDGALGHDATGAIERVRLATELAVGFVFLIVGEQELRELRRRADADRQYAGRERIERAAVTCARCTECALDLLDRRADEIPVGLSTTITACNTGNNLPRQNRRRCPQ